MDLLLQDVRFGFRRLVSSPLFTAVATLSLALGIGANTAIFSIVNAVLLRHPPYADAESLVEVYTSDTSGFEEATSSYPDYLDMRTSPVFEDAAGTEVFMATVEPDEQADGASMLMGELVTGNYFDLLGIRPALGRTFVPEEDVTPDTHPVVVLSYGYWQRVFASDPGVIGRTIRINRQPYTVVGVAAAGYKGTIQGLAVDAFVPFMMVNRIMPGDGDRLEQRGSRSMFVKARLRDGVTAAQANEAMKALATRLAQTYPSSNENRRMSVLPTLDVSVHPMVDRALVPVAALLLSVVALVLLIACANLASFLLARAADRRREIAVRLAIGASRIQLARQLLVESVMLALLGGVFGIALAWIVVRLLVNFQPPLPIPIHLDISIDMHVLLFTLGVSVLAGIAFGLAPGLQAARFEVAPTLREETGATGARRRVTLRGALVVGQVAFSLLLLVGSGLFVRSLQNAQAIDPGFDTGPAAILWPNTEMGGLDAAQSWAYYDELMRELAAEPGVTGVTLAGRLPLGSSIQTRSLNVEGAEPPAGQKAFQVDDADVDENYFDVMKVPIVAGRAFTSADNADAARVAIISEAMADRFWPAGDALGATFYLGENRERPVRIVGIAKDTKVRTLGESPRPYFYTSIHQSPSPFGLLVVKGSLPSTSLVLAGRRIARAVDPNVVLIDAQTMEQHLALLLFAPRMAALLLSVFGALALLLATIGLYGIVSYAVARRTREVGIRVALGADPRSVVAMLTGAGLRLVIVGGVIGLALSAGLTWTISRYLYGVGATDLVTFIGVPAILVGTGLLASWVPARRAARVDPLSALRTD